MSSKVIRTLKRMRKETYLFKFSSQFEYITVSCNGTWRPSNLRVIWLRSHRRVESIPVSWVVREDRGPNGAEGRGQFKPAFTVGLIVTLYKNTGKFEGKEYKYYIQDESEKGNKIVASFTIDLAEYAHIDGSEDKLEMTFYPESRKVNNVILGMTLSCQFLKKGKETDDDMQSTFSALTVDQDVLNLDSDEEEEEEKEEDRGGKSHKDSQSATPTSEQMAELQKGFPVSHSLDRCTLSRDDRISCPLTVARGKEIATNSSQSAMPQHSKVASKGVADHQPMIRESSSPSILSLSPNPLPDGSLTPSSDVNELMMKLAVSTERLQNEWKFYHACTEVQGWLYKRGVSGLTGRVWRKRYFRCEQGSKICYYKTRHASTPQGFIDLDLVLGVEEVEPSLQDKNFASFLVRCEGRTFQLQAIDHSTMMKWMSAIEFLVHWRKERKQKGEDEIGASAPLYPEGQ